MPEKQTTFMRCPRCGGKTSKYKPPGDACSSGRFLERGRKKDYSRRYLDYA